MRFVCPTKYKSVMYIEQSSVPGGCFYETAAALWLCCSRGGRNRNGEHELLDDDGKKDNSDDNADDDDDDDWNGVWSGTRWCLVDGGGTM